MPFGLYHDSSVYDPGRTSILLPQSIYPITSREFLLSLTGAQAYGSVDLSGAGFLDYTGFYGTLFFDPSETTRPVAINVPYTAGGRLMWETPLDGLHVGASILALKLTGSVGAGSFATQFRLPALLWVASSEYTIERLKL